MAGTEHGFKLFGGNGKAEEPPANPYDIAWEALEHLAQTRQGVEKLFTNETHGRWRTSGAANASGVCDLTLPPSGVRPGYETFMERVATTAPRNGELQIYVDGVDPLNLVEEITAPMRYTDAFNNDIWVPDGSVVVCHFTGMNVGDICTVSIQVRRITLPPKHAHYDQVEESGGG